MTRLIHKNMDVCGPDTQLDIIYPTDETAIEVKKYIADIYLKTYKATFPPHLTSLFVAEMPATKKLSPARASRSPRSMTNYFPSVIYPTHWKP